ncbi:hypothetical protein Bresu_2991 [Brevundimonas subvibrioides ATCC 15264]|uniref:Uncharacterized protein n=1 Tax=Brevundimonas subvibrioides (strain ATCC 15264 / DSM 4735 / LMG 14903 / NBRC 16000 / CB 81) TaxID=633149 RepID=D9QNR2_BRESC|nr:hypothetical protein Bresu_2991 [Brevundimonas subvibrioides ATCC 15264]
MSAPYRRVVRAGPEFPNPINARSSQAASGRACIGNAFILLPSRCEGKASWAQDPDARRGRSQGMPGRNPGSGGALGVVACRGLRLGKGQIGTAPRRRGRGPRRCPTQDIPPPNACENRSSGATATTPKLFYRRPSATAVVTVPGEIALAPPLPRPVHSGRAMMRARGLLPIAEGRWGGGTERSEVTEGATGSRQASTRSPHPRHRLAPSVTARSRAATEDGSHTSRPQPHPSDGEERSRSRN